MDYVQATMRKSVEVIVGLGHASRTICITYLARSFGVNYFVYFSSKFLQ